MENKEVKIQDNHFFVYFNNDDCLEELANISLKKDIEFIFDIKSNKFIWNGGELIFISLN